MRACVPSQNGFVALPPHRHNRTLVTRASRRPGPLTISRMPRNCSGPSVCGSTARTPSRTGSMAVSVLAGLPACRLQRSPRHDGNCRRTACSSRRHTDTRSLDSPNRRHRVATGPGMRRDRLPGRRPDLPEAALSRVGHRCADSESRPKSIPVQWLPSALHQWCPGEAADLGRWRETLLELR